MASSHVVVLDSAFKRTQVKVTPGRYMREVLEEACRARKLDPEAYMLKTQSNKPVDLSQPFRLSGLSAGAKLQLTQASRSASVVNVALQLPESEGGGKIVDKFPSTTSLWLVLRKYEDAVAGQPPRKLNLTQRATPLNVGSGSGRLEYEQPCLNIMGRSLETFTDLQKTLSQIGVSGSVMMRLTFKTSGQPLEEAMIEIEQYFKASDTSLAATSNAGAHASADGTMHSVPDASAENAALPNEDGAGPEPSTTDSPMPDATVPVEPDDVIATSSITEVPSSTSPAPEPLNGISVYLPPSSSTPLAATQEDDPSTYEPDITTAKAHQAALTRAGKNTRLLSDAELAEQARQREAQLSAVKSVNVRVRYPDQSITQMIITPDDTPADLYSKVTDTLSHPNEKYELRFAGPKGPHQILPPTSPLKLVKDFGFRGSILLTLVWSSEASAKARQAPSLKEEYRNRAQELKVELQSQRESGQENHREAMAKPESQAGDVGKGKGKGGDIEAKMKKFLGFGRK